MSDLPLLISSDGCADSLRARTWLVAHGVTFVEYNNSREPARATVALGARITATPLLVTAHGVIFGYQPDAYDESLHAPVHPAIAAPIHLVAN